MRVGTCRNIVTLLTTFFITVPFVAWGDKNVTVSGKYRYYLSDEVPEKTGRTIALERARLAALADAFGTFVRSTTTNSSREDSHGLDNTFNIFSTADVAGVWLRTLDEHVERVLDGKDIVLEAYVRGEARERNVAKPCFEATVGRVDDSGQFIPATSFYERERFDLQFVSPEDGYVSVYASDGVNDACRLLPAPSSNLSQPVHVRRGEVYRFFQETNPVMTLGPDEETAILRFTVLFHPDDGERPYTLPIDSSRVGGNGDILGWSIGNRRYQEWLGKALNDKQMQRSDINVSIKKQQ